MPNNIGDAFKRSVFFFLRRIWRVLPTSFRYNFWRGSSANIRLFFERQVVARPAKRLPQDPNAPLVVAGLFSTASGLGEAARSTYKALVAAGLSPIAVDLSTQLAPVDNDTDIPLHPMPEDNEGILIMQINGPETIPGLQHLGMMRGRHWYTIGYWAWELPNFPKGWDVALPFVSELWAISTFTQHALEQHPRVPKIKVFGHPITPPDEIAVDRAQFDFPKDAFVFLTMADSMSSITRKNPFAAIAAHKLAFGDDPNRILVIKTRNLDNAPDASKDIHKAIGDATNIRLLDTSLTDQKIWELLQAADCFVSLHRSEGFGLVLAEAMALGKPVVTTAWSGNMDFTTPENAYLVKMQLVPCKDPYGIYQDRSAQWADASIDDAASQLKAVVANAPHHEGRVDMARTTMREQADQKVLGMAMAAQIARAPTAKL